MVEKDELAILSIMAVCAGLIMGVSPHLIATAGAVTIFAGISVVSYKETGSYKPVTVGAVAFGAGVLIVVGSGMTTGQALVGAKGAREVDATVSEVDPPHNGKVVNQADRSWKIKMNAWNTRESFWKGQMSDFSRAGQEKERHDNYITYWIRYRFKFTIRETQGHWADEDFHSGHETHFLVTAPQGYDLVSAKKISEKGGLQLNVSTPSASSFHIWNGSGADSGSHFVKVQFTIKGTEPVGNPNPPGGGGGVGGNVPLWALIGFGALGVGMVYTYEKR